MKKRKIDLGDEPIPIPDRCPGMKDCKELMDWDSFTGFCDTSSWIYCEQMKEQSKKYKRKPREWKLVQKLGGISMSTRKVCNHFEEGNQDKKNVGKDTPG